MLEKMIALSVVINTGIIFLAVVGMALYGA